MNKKPSTIFEIFADDGWHLVLLSLKHGEIPESKHLAAALRGPYAMPDQVRAYLAEFFAGRIKKPRGRPSTIHQRMRRSEKRDYHVLMTFYDVIEEMRRSHKSRRSGTPSEEAFEEVATRVRAMGIHLSPSQVRAIVYHPRFGIQRRRRSR